MSALKCLCFAILLTQCLAQTEEPKFRKDFKYVKDLNAFYKLEKVTKKWTDALESCRAQGSELIVPKSKREIEKVLELFDIDGNGAYYYISWIAAHDMFNEGEFISVDGKRISESYLKWKDGEPNNLGSGENCIVMDVKGEYLDVPCDIDVYGICKKSAENLSRNNACDTYDQKYIFSSSLNGCYKFHTTPMTWHRAFKTCRDEETMLAVINSENEAKLFTTLFAQHPASSLRGKFEKNAIHLGFNDFYTQGVYLTIAGQTLKKAGYDNWNPVEPNTDTEHCGGMLRDGTLNNIDCKMKAMYICEKTLTITVREEATTANSVQPAQTKQPEEIAQPAQVVEPSQQAKLPDEE